MEELRSFLFENHFSFWKIIAFTLASLTLAFFAFREVLTWYLKISHIHKRFDELETEFRSLRREIRSRAAPQEAPSEPLPPTPTPTKQDLFKLHH